MTAICTEGLTKRYGKTVALDRLDLTVEAGEVYGYNGSGEDNDDPAPARPGPADRGARGAFGIAAWRDPWRPTGGSRTSSASRSSRRT